MNEARQNADYALANLADRLENAVRTLNALAGSAASSRSQSDYRRTKAEGVRLALSYVYEMQREIQNDGSVSDSRGVAG